MTAFNRADPIFARSNIIRPARYATITRTQYARNHGDCTCHARKRPNLSSGN